MCVPHLLYCVLSRRASAALQPELPHSTLHHRNDGPGRARDRVGSISRLITLFAFSASISTESESYFDDVLRDPLLLRVWYAEGLCLHGQSALRGRATHDALLVVLACSSQFQYSVSRTHCQSALTHQSRFPLFSSTVTELRCTDERRRPGYHVPRPSGQSRRS